jgi:uncharacterized protein YggT (Ycf19 family)
MIGAVDVGSRLLNDSSKQRKGLMEMTDIQGAFWIYQAPNLLISAMMYTIIGRFVLSLVFPTDSDMTIWRVFKQITDPVINAVAAITPINVPERVIYIFAFLWLFAARVMLYIMLRMYGLAPSIVS